ncbi:MAG TPA: hypothetical protein VLX58_12420 [Bryobacteraceae bacterium]|nr:hypothetical protein [Bryobacteraceae bacterium]
MVSGRLIYLIESHQEEIANRILHAIHCDTELVHAHQLHELELRKRGRQILKNLGHWLAEGNEAELAKEYESVGKARYEESVPLHESVRMLCITKDKMVDFVLQHGMTKDSLELYAEEELEHRLGRFFDLLVIHLVRGYEGAWRRAMHAAA